MVWYLNFCAPLLPNDPTMNFHRYFQTGLLAVYTLVYILLHLYYLFCAPMPITHRDQNESTKRDRVENQSQSENSSNQDHKQVSIKLQEHANDSCIQLKKTGTTWSHSPSQELTHTTEIVQNVTLRQIQQYHSIVYGHYAVALGLSTMYTPYAEQSGVLLFYAILTFPLIIANSRRWQYATRVIWIIMATLLMFIFTTGLLQIGQSNWDVLNLNCFANLYDPYYS